MKIALPILITLGLLSALPLFAQKVDQTYYIEGKIIDSATMKPVEYATLVLLNKATRKPIKGNIADETGHFRIVAPGKTSYLLTISYVGFQSRTNEIYLKGDTSMNLIKLVVDKKLLKDVTVSANRPILKQEIDRLSYDVQADPESKALSVLEIMRKVPLLSLDAGGSILMKGKGNFKILINGKTSSLVARNPSDVLRAMPANSIDKIEVITVPPAKYDAEGLAGIINIITKRKVDDGYNGNVNLKEHTINGPALGGYITLKKDKFGVVAVTGFNDQITRRSVTENQLQTFGQNSTLLDQIANNSTSGIFRYLSSELSYELDTLNLLTATLNLNKGVFDLPYEQSSKLYDLNAIPIQSYSLKNDGKNTWNGTDVALNYQMGFQGNKDRLLTFSYKYSVAPATQIRDIAITNRLNYGLPCYHQENESGSHEHTAQVDYVQSLKKVNLEIGAKAILRNNFSDFITDEYQVSSNTFVPDQNNSEHFDYNQNIFSLYNSYQFKLNKWGGKAGWRIEETGISAKFEMMGGNINDSYFNFIPSISVQHILAKGGSLNFGFTNRIQRPGIFELNPFVNQQNPKFLSSGNPELKPVTSHIFDLTYSKFKKASLILGLSYAYANNSIQSVTRLLDTVTFTTFQNVGSDKTLSGNMNFSYPLTKKMSVNFNGSLSKVWLKGFVNGFLYLNHGIQGYSTAYLSYRVNTTLRLGVNGGYNSANVMLQGKSSSYYSTSVSAYKDILHKKGLLFLAILNPFEKNITSATNVYEQSFYQKYSTTNPYRALQLGFNYNFGKLKSSIKRNKVNINNDDLKEHSKNPGT